MKIKQHDLYAEIIPDKVVVYNYIVRRVGMDEILYWGKENTEEAARKAAKLRLDQLTNKQSSHARTDESRSRNAQVSDAG